MSAIALKPVQPEESVAYFRQKGYRIGFDHRDVWRQEHQAAFTVAKAMHMDLLRDIRGQVDKAITEGTSFGTFQRELSPKLQARGWWGKQDVVDPVSGDTVRAQLGSARRMEVIFDANLATAYSEGQWERIQRGKGLFPFLEYGHSASEHPRLEHKAYAGTVLRADDPWWQVHMPVKKWGCKCPVYQHNARTLERGGLKLGTAPAEQMRTLTNQRTGETMEVPVGVDPAFHYPPGGRRPNLGRMMMDKADAATSATAAKVLADGVTTWAPLVQTEFGEFVGRYVEGERREVGARRVVGAFAPQVVASLQAAGLAPEKATLFVDMPRLRHLLGLERSQKRQAKGSGETFVASLPELLSQAGEVWLEASDQEEPKRRDQRGAEPRVVLLCTSVETGKVAKVVVALNETVHRAERGNAVTSMDLIDPRSFKRKGLARLDQ
ncbi:Phage Mu protein F like protein [Rhodoferax sp. OV413]|uniref:phage head morphogenesis protein n=1 Tax=Rhodoferax sp. OV413 TaxID=1855285 RepID=UPI00088C17A3|nr:phage minor head protein [Rhodoferax sp. OV413]SDO76603.1 Phage Mu protein F like protein [Rhodoferax sp. OV413]